MPKMTHSTAPFQTTQTLLFDVGGRACTDTTVRSAVHRALELKVEHLVVASTTGQTAQALISAAQVAKYDGQIVIVGEHTGYHGPGHQAMTTAVRAGLEAAGATVILGTHALSGPPRSFRLRWGGIDTAEIIAETLRRISRGTKTCVEIALMAADANMIPIDKDVVAIGGAGGGADTAVVIRAANMNSFFEIKIREFIALPRLRVAEVLKPAFEQNKRGKSAEEIAVELGVNVSLIHGYLQIIKRVTDRQAEGLTLNAALTEADVDGDVISTLKELLAES